MTQTTTLEKKQVATLLKFGYNYKQIASLYSLPKKEIKQLAKSEWNLRCPSWPAGLRLAFPSGINEEKVSKWLPLKKPTDPANGENHP